MISLSQGEENLRQLIQSREGAQGLNEAQTRFHVIDRVLFDCLGWDRESEVEVEHAEGGKFTDYELGKPRLAILEAKRIDSVFELPAGAKKIYRSDLKSLMKASSNFSDAAEQARAYCSSRGVPVCIVSNGEQYVAFLASRQDGVSIFEGKALVFYSLDAMLDNFPLAWKMISSEGVKERNIFSYLSDGPVGIPNKLSSRLNGYPTIRYASEVQATLRQLSELFLQDAVESPEQEERFYNECYCTSGALSKYALLSKQILESRYASLFDKKESAPYVAPVKGKKKDNFTPDILTESSAKRPIVLIGDVGVGKTSFVKSLIYNSAYEEFKNAIYVYIDLGTNASLTSDLKSFVLSEIEDQLYSKYGVNVEDFGFVKGVYASEINRFNGTMWGQKKDSDTALYETKLFEMLEGHIKQRDKHLKKSISAYSKSSKRQIIIAIDNADQRTYEVQQDAFIISQELAKEWSSTVFISVRPQTFFKSKRSGALSAYPHKVFTISPPRIDEVITKRLTFALEMAEGSIPIETLDSVRVNAGNLAVFIRALLTSLERSAELNEFLTNITGGNIRAAIAFVTSFIGSPNVDADKIIRIMQDEGSYLIPLHEFTKSAVLGDYSHYNPDTSDALNIYDLDYPGSHGHFLIAFLLSYLMQSGPHRDNDGFVQSRFVFDEMQDLAFNSEQVSKALRRCTNKKLIETSQRITFEEDVNGALIGEMPDAFRITSVGAYHVNRWAGTFTYLDAMVFDTPIFDESVRDLLVENIGSLAIADRYRRAASFKSYLNSCWQKTAAKPSYFNLLDIFHAGKPTFFTVKRAIDANANSA
ncbi:P-loop NTPase fold protein [Salinicola sp. RZ23]|uniref:P-loop NTPase fold protein n=1 Tax=Salinicola sp. RZ23 TaxID=1949087 RepID=UPI000DA1BF31|nr:P-loop NTPase fold protein [Salinicola sp. RZ23]